MAARELDDNDQNFLLGIVDGDGGGNDYDDGLEGWPAYDITGDVLTIAFTTDEEDSEDRTRFHGRWRLTYLDGEVDNP